MIGTLERDVTAAMKETMTATTIAIAIGTETEIETGTETEIAIMIATGTVTVIETAESIDAGAEAGVASAGTTDAAHAPSRKIEGRALAPGRRGTAADATAKGATAVGTAAIMTSHGQGAEEGAIAAIAVASAAETTRAMTRRMASLRTERPSLTMLMVPTMETIITTARVAARTMSWTVLTALTKLQTTMTKTMDLHSRRRMRPMLSTMMRTEIQSSLLKARWKTKSEF